MILNTATQEMTPAQHAQKALDSIRANPDSFNMDYWIDFNIDYWIGRKCAPLEPGDDVCGTTMCVAGWIAHNAGYTLDNLGYCGEGSHVRDVAAQALGLNWTQSVQLFNTTESVATRVLERLAAGIVWQADEDVSDYAWKQK